MAFSSRFSPDAHFRDDPDEVAGPINGFRAGFAATIRPWTGDPAVGRLSLHPAGPPPPPALLSDVIEQARRAGYQSVLSGAILNREQLPYKTVGFSLAQPLRVLHRKGRWRDAMHASNPNIRDLNEADIDRVVAVDQSAFESFWWFGPDGIREALAITRHSHYRGFVVDDQIAGFSITGRVGRRGYVQRIAVAPEYQNNGVGKALLSDALSWLGRHFARRVIVNTQTENAIAYRMYTNFGFTETNDKLAVLIRPL